MSSKKKIKWDIQFDPNFTVLLIDLTLRIAFIIPVVLEWSLFHPLVNVFLQVFTTFFTIYISNRRSKAICSFLEMRLLSEQSEDNEEGVQTKKSIQFYDIDLHTKTVDIKSNGLFVFLLFLIPVFSAAGIFGHYVGQFTLDSDVRPILILFGSSIGFYFLYWKFKDVFISTRISEIKKNGRKLSKKRQEDLLNFISRDFTLDQEVELSEKNDFLIIELQTKIKIFRERLENLSLEGVFLGALSFATLMQLIGPENIDSLSKMVLNHDGTEMYFDSMLQQISLQQSWFVAKSSELRLATGIAIITIGSLLASVFYIIVLIKRFSILKSIEFAQLKIERANSWNDREEKELREKNILKSIRFTDQIQIELASANQICQEIQSNISLVSLIRTFGIFSFFVVILVTAAMIHHYLFVFSLLVALYGLLASLLMNNKLSLIRMASNSSGQAKSMVRFK